VAKKGRSTRASHKPQRARRSRPVANASSSGRRARADAGGRKLSASRVTKPRSSGPARTKVVAQSGTLTVSEVAELEALRRELDGATNRLPFRWNADPDDVQKSVAQLVLTLVEFIRKLLERQAIRRMEAGTLTDEQTEDVGRALMQLEATIREIAARFGLAPEELNLDLGPVGRLI
jgi:hypothetical protein